MASGHIEPEIIRPQFDSDGVVDSLHFLAARTDSVARHLTRLIVMPICNEQTHHYDGYVFVCTVVTLCIRYVQRHALPPRGATIGIGMRGTVHSG